MCTITKATKGGYVKPEKADLNEKPISKRKREMLNTILQGRAFFVDIRVEQRKCLNSRRMYVRRCCARKSMQALGTEGKIMV